MTNHKRIWLAPDCECWRSGDGRMWCEDREPLLCEEEGCTLEPVEYIRADLVKSEEQK